MSESVQTLPEDCAYELQRCEGFLDLKMTRPARAAWEKVAALHSAHPDVESLQMRLLVEEKDWASARDLALRWRERNPDDAGAWIQLAYATRRSNGLAAAEKILLAARAKFPREPIIPYNLACYACQSQRLDEARSLLNEASTLDPQCIQLASGDDDLEPLWGELP